MSPKPAEPGAPLPRAVVALGWVSLLTDAASDMIYPLVPAFLMSLGGGAAALGVIEGVAELVAAVMKVVSGRITDRTGKRKALVAWGYGISALARPLFSIVTAPAHAVAVRAADRVGKGLRGPPRDTLLAAAAPAEIRARAFGFHRMMDNLGGVVGPLLAFALLGPLGADLRTVFALSLFPGLASVLVVLLLVRDTPAPTATPTPTPASPLAGKPPPGPLSPATRRYLAALALFALASSGDLFLLRRLSDLGLGVALVPVAWISLQLAKGLFNVPGGRAADRVGKKRVLALAWVLYAGTYAGFALAPSWPVAWALLAIYALHYGLAEGGQRALLADYAQEDRRGRAYGYQLALEGALALPANLLFGLVYDRLGADVAFLAGGAVALLAAATLSTLVPAPPTPTPA